ncbi:MAG: hypothetical protein ACJ74O_02715 [Frankiaceae bacterium]
MLVTASAGLPLDSLAAGLAVTWRHDRRPLPTAENLGRWSDDQDWLVREGECVCLAGPLSERWQRLVASTSDRVLEATLRAAPEQTLRHQALSAALQDASFTRAAALFAITTAPILTRVRRGYYRLRLH